MQKNYDEVSKKNINLNKEIQQKNYIKAREKSKNIEKCIKIKFGIFFILTVLLLVFFWYYISCFCGIYINTQIHLIKDTIISFITSLIYPFGFYLIPGILRIYSLNMTTFFGFIFSKFFFPELI